MIKIKHVIIRTNTNFINHFKMLNINVLINIFIGVSIFNISEQRNYVCQNSFYHSYVILLYMFLLLVSTIQVSLCSPLKFYQIKLIQGINSILLHNFYQAFKCENHAVSACAAWICKQSVTCAISHDPICRNLAILLT